MNYTKVFFWCFVGVFVSLAALSKMPPSSPTAPTPTLAPTPTDAELAAREEERVTLERLREMGTHFRVLSVKSKRLTLTINLDSDKSRGNDQKAVDACAIASPVAYGMGDFKDSPWETSFSRSVEIRDASGALWVRRLTAFYVKREGELYGGCAIIK